MGLQEDSIKYAAENSAKFFPKIQGDIVRMSFVANALAHGYFTGAQFKFPESKFFQRIIAKLLKGITRDLAFKAANEAADSYVAEIPAVGEDRIIIHRAFYLGFYAGIESIQK